MAAEGCTWYSDQWSELTALCYGHTLLQVTSAPVMSQVISWHDISVVLGTRLLLLLLLLVQQIVAIIVMPQLKQNILSLTAI